MINSIKTKLELMQSKFSNSDPDWVQFIYDHKYRLMSSSEIVAISPENAFKFRFRPNELCKELGIKEDIIWIILWMNDIFDPSEFVGITQLRIIPDIKIIQKLHATYVSWKTTLTSSESELSAR